MNLLYKIIHRTPFPLRGARNSIRAIACRIREVCQTNSKITVEVNGGAALEPKVPERLDREGFCCAVIGATVHQRV